MARDKTVKDFIDPEYGVFWIGGGVLVVGDEMSGKQFAGQWDRHIERDGRGRPKAISFSPSPSEHEIQKTFFEWLETYQAKHPLFRLFYAIPNGGKRHISTARKLKAEGQKPGVPDCHLPVPNRTFAGLWIEFKSGRKKLTDYQEQWKKDLEKQGHRVAVCYSWAEAAEVTLQYLGFEKR